VTKAADGTTTAEPMPSTEKEKWGRIAAAVIGGALKGMGAGQGPGGAGKALAAGGQYGMQLPQQMKENVQKDVTADQQQQTFKANKALTQQQLAMNQFKLENVGNNIRQSLIDRANKTHDWITSEPSNQHLADFENEKDMLDYEAKNPGVIVKGHTNGEFHAEPTVLANGKPGISLYAVDGDWMKRKNDKDVTYKILTPGDKLSDPMQLKDFTVPKGGDTNGNISLKMEAESKKISDYGIAMQKANKPKTPTEDEGLEDQYLQDNKLPDTFQNRLAARSKISAATRKPGEGAAAPPYQAPQPGQATTTKNGEPIEGQEWGGGKPSSAFENTARQLALGEKLENDLPKRVLKGQPSITNYSNRARQISQDMFGADFEYNPQQAQKEAKFAGQEKVIAAYNAMDRLAGQSATPGKSGDGSPALLDQLEQAAQAAGLSNAAPINALWQRAKQLWGDDAAKALQFDLAETRKSLSQVTGNPTLGSSDTNLKLEQMTQAYGENMTLSDLKRVNNEARTAIATEREAGFKNNRFLRRDYGGEAVTANPTGGRGTPPPPPPPPNRNPNPQPQPPKVGDVVMGRTYLGGNPALQTSWR
jgi:hypothetical protein